MKLVARMEQPANRGHRPWAKYWLFWRSRWPALAAGRHIVHPSWLHRSLVLRRVRQDCWSSSATPLPAIIQQAGWLDFAVHCGLRAATAGGSGLRAAPRGLDAVRAVAAMSRARARRVPDGILGVGRRHRRWIAAGGFAGALSASGLCAGDIRVRVPHHGEPVYARTAAAGGKADVQTRSCRAGNAWIRTVKAG